MSRLEVILVPKKIGFGKVQTSALSGKKSVWIKCLVYFTVWKNLSELTFC